jgi:hypothetical protein
VAKLKNSRKGRGKPRQAGPVTVCLLVGRVVAWDRRGKDGSRGKGSFKRYVVIVITLRCGCALSENA